mgnify:FL=1
MSLKLATKQKTIKIVVIEDNRLTRLSLKSALNEYEDISVIGDTEDTFTGQMMVKEIEPDIVLIDLGLSDGNGIEAISKIRARNKSVKIIALTSHSNNQEVLNALMNGANAYCVKNIDLDEFVNVIRDITENTQTIIKT